MRGSLGVLRPGSLLGLLAAAFLFSCGLAGSGLASRAEDSGLPNGDAAVGDASGGDFVDVLAGEGGDGAADGGADGDSSSATAADADGATDKGDAPNPGDGPQGPSPGVINCAGTSCSIGSNVCCTCANCFPPFPTSCFPAFPGCVTGVPVRCDDRTDCTAGQVCCGSLSGASFTGSTCKASCAAGDVQLCAVSAECATGSCKASTTVPGFSACM